MGSVQTFKLNQVNSGDTFDFTTASSDASGLLYDREFNNQLASVASADGTNEKFKVTFDTPQDISAVGLMNHNIKTGNVKYLNSGLAETDFSVAISFSANTDTNSYFDTFTEVSDAYGIVVNCDYTIDAGEKKIGQLLSLESLYSFDSAKRLAPRLKIQQEFNTKSDGGLDKIINGVKHSGSVKFDNLDSTDIGNLFALAIHPDPFWIYLAGLSDTNLKQFFKVDDIYLVNMTNEPYPQMPSGLVDSIGWVDKIDYSEV